MKYLLATVLACSIVPIAIVGCKSSQTTKPLPDLKGQVKIPYDYSQRPIPPKVTPYSYTAWMSASYNLQAAREYEDFLNRHGVGNIIPSFELLRTARDWEKCGRSEYMVPNRELWINQVATLRVFKQLVATRILTEYEVTSVYRDLPLNRCAGGANSSRHLFNSAIDFRIGPKYPQSQDYAFIEHTKFRLCQFWSQHGQSLNMGLGLYSTGQIHIDTFGYRTWGPNLSRSSSPCHY